MAQYEVLDSVYNDNTQQISVFLGLKDVEEVNPPSDPLPGHSVDNIRWIRKVTETFVGRDLEVHSSIVSVFSPSSTELFLYDVSRFPNNGLVVINIGSATEEIITYTGRDLSANKLTGISVPMFIHAIGELVYPSVDIDFLGAFEIDLRPFGVDNIRGPVRYGRSKVMLNGITELRENIDYVMANDFVGDICTRTRLRFQKGGQPRRFGPNEQLEVTYEFFVLHGDVRDFIQIYTSPGIVAYIKVFERGVPNIAFGTIQTVDKDVLPMGNVRITPPFSNTILPPSPVKVFIPDVKLPANVVVISPVVPTDTTIVVSDVTRFPTPGILMDATDDFENRTIIIDGDIITYTDIDKINNLLVGVSGIDTNHPVGSIVSFDGARFVRDVVKDAINKSTLRGQVEALSVDTGGRYIRIKIKGGTGTFNLQPGTYQLFYLGFDDNIDRGLHKDITGVASFDNKDFTFERYETIIRRQEIAKTLLGQTVSKRVMPTGTNPTDITFSVP